MDATNTRKGYLRAAVVFPPSQSDIPYSKYQPAIGIKSCLRPETSRESNDFRVRRQSCKMTRCAMQFQERVRARSIDTSGSPVHHLCEKGIYRSCLVLYLSPILKKSLRFYAPLSPHPLHNSLNRFSIRCTTL